ncbi:glycosyltransferase family 2 protein [Saccharopolyspora mangrovi]|uniref:Glycosyltransferase family 2 protein n=1 Tax=Saccharopolyspora mangrovi TaxID=3082379 RepID=A0ABU6AEM3_9PSEU|nr:glycosyltransferase family 2 protein [Saccharopolyspora sp. S2-29]MEB3369996.1 glycosyltransferase family 2 protein [Saccharopolyspora sp. S2-29]
MTIERRDDRHRPATDGLDATAIVVTYNSRDHVTPCLAALTRAGVLARVVDNASTDGTGALIAAHFPGVSMVLNPVNMGFAAAVNQALSAVDTDIVLLVNPDCVLPEPTAHALVHTLRTHPDVGVVGPRLMDAEGRIAISAHPFESLTSLLASRFGGGLVPVSVRRLLCGENRRRTYDACRQVDTPVTVDWLSGACLAVRTELLRQLGGLDEQYFMYYEDEELCLRAWRHGARVLHLPTVHATHLGGASSNDPAWLWPHLYRSLLRFFSRHRHRSYPAARAAVLLRSLIGIGLSLVRMPWNSGIARSRACAWARVARIALTASVRQ